MRLHDEQVDTLTATGAVLDHQRRDKWITRCSGSMSVLVAEDVTLADVHRWLKEVVNL